MADLNQIINDKKSGQKVVVGSMELIIGIYNRSNSGPICCYYEGPLGEANGEGYTNLRDFGTNPSNPDTRIIACSRGFIPKQELSNDPRTFLDKVCKSCVEEAQTYIKNLK